MIGRLSSAVALSLALAGIVAASGACSSDEDPAAGAGTSSSGAASSGATSSGGSPALTTAECKSRCNAKLTKCQAPSGVADQGCTTLCDGTVTEAQGDCLEEKDCEELEALGAGGSLESICPKSSGGSSSSSSGNGSSSSSSSGNTSNDTPTSLTITATIPSDYETIHTKTDNTVASLFNVAPQPSFDPDVQINSGHLPLLDKAGSVTLDSPARPSGACGTAKFTFVLNSSQIGVQIAGTDELPDTDCATFTDKLVKGATWTLKDVPWSNSTVKATVKVVLE